MDKKLKYTSYKQEKEQTIIIINKKLATKDIRWILAQTERIVEYILSDKE